EHRLAEERVATLLLHLEQGALNGADRRGRHIPVLRRELRGAVADELEHRPEIFQVQEQQAAIVSHLEDEREHALLRGIETQQTAEQQRTEIRDRGANWMPTFPKHVPEDRWIRAPLRRCRLDRLQALAQLRGQRAWRGDAGEIAFDVSQKNRDAG